MFKLEIENDWWLYSELRQHLRSIFLTAKISSTVKGLRLIVTPFRKSCSEQDVRCALNTAPIQHFLGSNGPSPSLQHWISAFCCRIQRYSHCNNDAGRCHNTQLFCKQLVSHHSVKNMIKHLIIDDVFRQKRYFYPIERKISIFRWSVAPWIRSPGTEPAPTNSSKKNIW